MDTYLRQRIENITEADLWSSLRPVPGLKKAIAAGRSGRKAAAYRLLGEYHAKSLASEASAFATTVGDAVRRSKDVAAIRNKADTVLRHEIDGWHSRVQKFGKVIDFNADFGQSGQYGFHYLGWLLPVLQQYVRTGDTKYRDGLIDIIKQYYDQRAKLKWRIPTLHPVYYELGAWAKTNLILPAYACLVREEQVDVKAREAMLKLLLGFGRSLHRIAEPGYRAGNWQIVGCAGLYWLGAALPEFAESAAWRRRGADRIRQHAEKDFFADGGHGERCWGYGTMSLSGMHTFYKAAVRHHRLKPAQQRDWQRFFHRCWRWYAASTTPSRHGLNYGDGTITDMTDTLKQAVAHFPQLGRGPGLLGVDRSTSNVLRPSGYAFMRSGDKPDAPFMSINFGGHGGFHTHDDLLDFTIWRWGEPLIEEVGRFGSYDNPLDPMFRSARSHNQVVLENLPMDRRSHEGRDVRWLVSDAVDMFSAWHEAYAPVRTQRQIMFVKPDYWVVYDVIIDSEYGFQATSYLHGVKPFRSIADGKWRLAGSPSCLVAAAEPQSIRRVETGTDYTVDNLGDRAKDPETRRLMGERHRMGLMKWNDIGNHQPITFAMLLAPFKGAVPRASIGAVKLTGDDTDRARAYAVNFRGRRDVFVFNPGRAAVRCERRTTNATMAAKIAGKWIDSR